MFDRTGKQAAMQISLVAELDAVGFMIGSLFYGEYGILEPSASIDVIGVTPEVRRKRIGASLMRQLRLHLGALGLTVIRTEVEWSDIDLLSFLKRERFSLGGAPLPRASNRSDQRLNVTPGRRTPVCASGKRI